MRRFSFLVLAACGSDPVGPVDAGDAQTIEAAPEEDAGADVTEPVDSAPSGYPAFTPWMGQLKHQGGPTLANPVVVTITWDGDSARPSFEQFGDDLGATTYWSAGVGEYGIGPTTSGSANHVHVTTTPPTSMSDSTIRSFLQANAGTLLPAATSETIYMVYLSPATTLMFGGQSACNIGVGGYHDSVPISTQQIAYGVIPRCGGVSQATAAASHEIGEAVTDPQPDVSPAYVGFEDPYLVFELWQRYNVENGDACEFFKDSYYTEIAPFPFTVQRLWSNKQGPLGHSPCQPFTNVYFNVAPLDLQDITIDLTQLGGSASFKTKGYTAKLGETIQIPIGLYSDAPTTGPFTITVAESNPLVNPVTGRLTLSVDSSKTSGVNGDKTFITATVTQVGPIKGEMFTVISTLGTQKHYLPLLIASP